MFTEPMLRLWAIVLERDAEKATEALIELGVMQFISVNDLGVFRKPEVSNSNDSQPLKDKLAKIAELRKRTESLLESVNLFPAMPASIVPSYTGSCDLNEAAKTLDAIVAEQQRIREKQRYIQTEILKYEEIKRQIDLYGVVIPQAAKGGDRFSYVLMRIGSVPSERVSELNNKLRDIPSVTVPLGEKEGRNHLMVIGVKRNRELIDKCLSECGWTSAEIFPETYEVRNSAGAAIEDKLRGLREEQKLLQEKTRTVIIRNRDALTGLWIRLRMEELYAKVRSTFEKTDHTVLFSGWAPSDERTKIDKALRKATQGRYYIEWLTPGQSSDLNEQPDAPPVKLKNPSAFAPFEMLVTNFGIPEYGTIDPTAFVVLTYLIMFGMMFADMGQGAVVALLGILGTFLIKRNRTYRNLSWLLVWCGGSSVIFGALFGSVFGYPLVKPLWFNYHGIVNGETPSSGMIRSIYDILGISVRFGICVIGCGLLFNWINLIRKRKWMELVFEKGGLLGGWIYCGGVYCSFFTVNHDFNSLPASPILTALLGVPAVLMLGKGPVELLMKRKLFSPAAVARFIMEWVVEMLEIFSGYLANTLSFMRVAGLGIAHVCLMGAFFSMAGAVKGQNPGITESVASIALIVTGNIMVILLEGLSAGIQALRLNYYEFFTKFFHGTGKLFSPIGIHEPHYL